MKAALLQGIESRACCACKGKQVISGAWGSSRQGSVRLPAECAGVYDVAAFQK